MTQDELKAAVADKAISEIEPWLEKDTVLGIGTGSTANLFIDRPAAPGSIQGRGGELRGQCPTLVGAGHRGIRA